MIKLTRLVTFAMLTTPSLGITAPGTLSQLPLFISDPTEPNIFFLLDDSGSMHWKMPADGVTLSDSEEYDITPDKDGEWYSWCVGANLMAYDPSMSYKPWAANIPGTNTPFPNQTDLTHVWVDPLTQGSGRSPGTTIAADDTGTVDLSDAPVALWNDANNNGQFDNNECPTSFRGSGAARKASELSSAEKINFANWFSYYRIREHTAKAAVTQVVSGSSVRIGMATLHHNNNVGKPVTDMSDPDNKTALLSDVVNIDSNDRTPLRIALNDVGEYFADNYITPTTSCSRRGCTTTGSSIYLGSGAHASPILPEAEGGACQQNFAILMTDGEWNGDSPNVGSQDNTVDNKYVFRAHQDTTADTLADVAMKWYKTDLAPQLPAKVPVQTGDPAENLDENPDQHLVTYGVAFGPTGTLSSDPTDRNNSFNWPTPKSGQDTTIDDLRHAAYNGRGKFLSAKKPQLLINSLQDIISNIESRQGSSSSVALNMSALSSGTQLYFAGFDTGSWTGNLDAYSLDSSTGDIITTPDWQAGVLLDQRSNTDMLNTRVIYTMGSTSTSSRDGVLFNWTTSSPQPETTIFDDFKQNPDLTADISPFTNSQARWNFVRGNTSDQANGEIRNRKSRLGDIINSAPLYVAEPNSNWPDSSLFGSSNYSTYQSNLETSPREPMVYVGANDGLLHGFSATTGKELVAYMPSALASTTANSGLHYYSDPNYVHRFYVDGELASADVYIDPENNGSRDWRTILVGSLRGGGQGLFALDVTAPTNFKNTETAAQSQVLWEFTNLDDSDLGFTYAKPEIALMNNGEWAVVTGNGYNATGTDTAKLMLLFIQKGIDGDWAQGDYVKIDTQVGTPNNKNGLSSPTLVDLDDNGTIDRIYAGDLLGNMWAFDVSDSNASNWKSAYLSGGNPTPLFAAGVSKPITMKPLISKPETNWLPDTTTNKPNLMVYFGTGQYISIGDSSNTDQQSFFGIWDSGMTVAESSLVEQTYLTPTATNTLLLSQNPVDYSNNPVVNLGWYIDLAESGERVVVEAFELEGIIYFNTMTPSETPCSAGGSSWLMSVDKTTGGTPTITSFDFDRNGVINAADGYAAAIKFENGIASKTSTLKTDTEITHGYTSGTENTSGTGPSVTKEILPGSLPPATGGRISWSQLINN